MFVTLAGLSHSFIAFLLFTMYIFCNLSGECLGINSLLIFGSVQIPAGGHALSNRDSSRNERTDL